MISHLVSRSQMGLATFLIYFLLEVPECVALCLSIVPTEVHISITLADNQEGSGTIVERRSSLPCCSDSFSVVSLARCCRDIYRWVTRPRCSASVDSETDWVFTLSQWKTFQWGDILVSMKVSHTTIPTTHHLLAVYSRPT
jgi:hypothetical protein